MTAGRMNACFAYASSRCPSRPQFASPSVLPRDQRGVDASSAANLHRPNTGLPHPPLNTQFLSINSNIERWSRVCGGLLSAGSIRGWSYLIQGKGPDAATTTNYHHQPSRHQLRAFFSSGQEMRRNCGFRQSIRGIFMRGQRIVTALFTLHGHWSA